MTRYRFFTATSLDGFLADEHDSLDWLLSQPTGEESILPYDVFVAEVELPGVDPASIDVDVEERTLTVRAERKEDPAREDRRWLTRERSAGTFARQLTLGEGLALDRIQADYSDGVLTLTIPVAEQAKPRKISVTHGGTAPVAGQTVEGESAEASGE